MSLNKGPRETHTKSEYEILDVGLRIRDSLRGGPNKRFCTYQNPIWGQVCPGPL